MNVWVALALTLTLGMNVSGGEDTNLFQNVVAGFSVRKPAEWVFVTAQQNHDNLARTKLNDAEFQKALLQYASVPLVAMAKHQEPYDDLNPSFKANLKPLGKLKGESPHVITAMGIAQMKSAFKDFTVVTAPTNCVVAGITGSYARVDYTLETQNGRTFPTTSELWILPRGDFFFMIGAGTRQDEKTGTRAEIQDILKTIAIAPCAIKAPKPAPAAAAVPEYLMDVADKPITPEYCATLKGTALAEFVMSRILYKMSAMATPGETFAEEEARILPLLTPALRTFYLFRSAEGQIGNGGIQAYYNMYEDEFPRYDKETIAAFREFGVESVAKLLEDASVLCKEGMKEFAKAKAAGKEDAFWETYEFKGFEKLDERLSNEITWDFDQVTERFLRDHINDLHE